MSAPTVSRAPSFDQLAANEDAILAALRGLGDARRAGDEDGARAAVDRVQLAARARVKTATLAP